MYAIATLVMGGNDYVRAAIALAKSIILTCCFGDLPAKVETVCMITDDVTEREGLEEVYDYVLLVPKISVGKDHGISLAPKASVIYHWIGDSPTKWNILALDRYEKVLFLDSDMIVCNNISELFLMETPAAMFDHQIAREYVRNPRWTGNKDKGVGFINWYKIFLGLETQSACTDLPLKTGTRIPPAAIDNLRRHSDTQFALHGGIVLVTPNRFHYNLYIQSLPSILRSLKKKNCLSGIDEITLCLFLSDMGYIWKHLGTEYNVAAFHTYNILQERTKILHYIGCYKPWNANEREYSRRKAEEGHSLYQICSKVIEIWWKVYELQLSSEQKRCQRELDTATVATMAMVMLKEQINTLHFKQISGMPIKAFIDSPS